jgi:hypothetical protein
MTRSFSVKTMRNRFLASHNARSTIGTLVGKVGLAK